MRKRGDKAAEQRRSENRTNHSSDHCCPRNSNYKFYSGYNSGTKANAAASLELLRPLRYLCAYCYLIKSTVTLLNHMTKLLIIEISLVWNKGRERMCYIFPLSTFCFRTIILIFFYPSKVRYLYPVMCGTNPLFAMTSLYQ